MINVVSIPVGGQIVTHLSFSPLLVSDVISCSKIISIVEGVVIGLKLVLIYFLLFLNAGDHSPFSQSHVYAKVIQIWLRNKLGNKVLNNYQN